MISLDQFNDNQLARGSVYFAREHTSAEFAVSGQSTSLLFANA
jgi:hypothetical protein